MRGIGDWLKVNGEGIYSTRPWKTVGEGIYVDDLRRTSKRANGKTGAGWSFDALEEKPGQAIRFTRSKDFGTLYAFVIGEPENGKVTMKTLRKGNVAGDGSGITSVSMLGSSADIAWNQNDKGLTLTFPESLPCEVAYGFKIRCKGNVDDAPREQLEDPWSARAAGRCSTAPGDWKQPHERSIRTKKPCNASC